MAGPEENSKVEGLLSPKGKELIAIFQEAISSSDLERQKKKTREFYEKLVKLINPGKENSNYSDEDLVKRIVWGEDPASAGGLWIAGGSSGQRILFRNYNPETEEVTPDRMVRYMIYPEPSSIGWEMWHKYILHFGGITVDLRQNVI